MWDDWRASPANADSLRPMWWIIKDDISHLCAQHSTPTELAHALGGMEHARQAATWLFLDGPPRSDAHAQVLSQVLSAYITAGRDLAPETSKIGTLAATWVRQAARWTQGPAVQKRAAFVLLDALWANLTPEERSKAALLICADKGEPWLTHRLDWLLDNPIACGHVSQYLVDTGPTQKTRTLLLGALTKCPTLFMKGNMIHKLTSKADQASRCGPLLLQALEVVVNTYDPEQDPQAQILYRMVFTGAASADQCEKAAKKSAGAHPTESRWASCCESLVHRPELARVVMPHAPPAAIAKAVHTLLSRAAKSDIANTHILLDHMSSIDRLFLWQDERLVELCRSVPKLAALRDHDVLTTTVGATGVTAPSRKM